MTVTVTDAELRVWHQDQLAEGDDEADADPDPHTIIGTDGLRSVEFAAHADTLKDEASIECYHPSAGGPDLLYDLRVGDRIEFHGLISTPVGGSETWGEGTWGEGVWGGGDDGIPDVRWMGRVQPTETSRDQIGRHNGSLSADATDWCGDILSNRKITGSWVGRDAGAVIRDIVRRKASEIDASEIPDIGDDVEVYYASKDCWDAVTELAALGDGLLLQEGRKLLLEPIEGLGPAIELTHDDYYLPWQTHTDNDVKNVVRIDSGESRQIEHEQGVQDDLERVTSESRITHQLRARKSRVHSVDLYVDAESDDEDLKVRLQADEDGEPVAIDDEDSDIDSAEWSASDLPSGGWQSFFFSDEILPDRDPWMIIETEGDEGHDIGVREDGVPTYTSFYPHPVNFEATDSASIADYGAREIPIEKDNLRTLTAARDAAIAELRRRAYPTKTISFPARSPRAHLLEPGDLISVDEPGENAVGEFIVVETARTFDSDRVRLETEITATWRKGVLAPIN
ncbi:hypothetical protein [Natronorarus salvus]|uniref:hypothetical protein n=1 Tax=Natronorarus salvus TaxID=3117733 RepID=UPI002F2654FD